MIDDHKPKKIKKWIKWDRKTMRSTTPRERQMGKWWKNKAWHEISNRNMRIKEKQSRIVCRGGDGGGYLQCCLCSAGGNVQHLQLEQRKKVCPQLPHCLYEHTVAEWDCKSNPPPRVGACVCVNIYTLHWLTVLYPTTTPLMFSLQQYEAYWDFRKLNNS